MDPVDGEAATRRLGETRRGGDAWDPGAGAEGWPEGVLLSRLGEDEGVVPLVDAVNAVFAPLPYRWTDDTGLFKVSEVLGEDFFPCLVVEVELVDEVEERVKRDGGLEWVERERVENWVVRRSWTGRSSRGTTLIRGGGVGV